MIDCPRGCGSAAFATTALLTFHLVEEHDAEHIAAMAEAQTAAAETPIVSLVTGAPLPRPGLGLGSLGLVDKHRRAAAAAAAPAAAPAPRPPTPEPVAPTRRPSRYFPDLTKKEAPMGQDPTKRCARCSRLNANHTPDCPRNPANQKPAKGKRAPKPPPRARRAPAAPTSTALARVTPAAPALNGALTLIRDTLDLYRSKTKALEEALAILEPTR